jgi:hypothetical protein
MGSRAEPWGCCAVKDETAKRSANAETLYGEHMLWAPSLEGGATLKTKCGKGEPKTVSRKRRAEDHAKRAHLRERI